VAVNPEKICFARGDEAFGEVVRKATFHICDGAGTAAAMRILRGVKIPRITGIELFYRMVAVAEEEGLSVFLLGAHPEVIRRAREKLCEKHPRLRVAGCLDGYFHEDGCEAIVREINASGADMLFVGLGSPKQERWITQYRSVLKTPFCMGVGGSFDVLSGRVKRAPEFFRRTGTEWLYRLAKEPRRWRRQIALMGFVMSVLWERIWPARADVYWESRCAARSEDSVSHVSVGESLLRNGRTIQADADYSDLVPTSSMANELSDECEGTQMAR
jgi:N-acetylglucosaminyldiphosphoundecaprenol N-acetyl-beta-D-mannosaminyltransferase